MLGCVFQPRVNHPNLNSFCGISIYFIPIHYDDALNIYLMNRQDEAVRWAALPT